jgi:flagellar biosynthesis GTPase FlhF
MPNLFTKMTETTPIGNLTLRFYKQQYCIRLLTVGTGTSLKL